MFLLLDYLHIYVASVFSTPNICFYHRPPPGAVYTFIVDTSIYKFGLSVCLYPINVKTAEPIGPKFFVGHLGTTGKVYE